MLLSLSVDRNWNEWVEIFIMNSVSPPQIIIKPAIKPINKKCFVLSPRSTGNKDLNHDLTHKSIQIYEKNTALLQGNESLGLPIKLNLTIILKTTSSIIVW